MTSSHSLLAHQGAVAIDANRSVPLRRHFTFWGLALAGCGVDLATKHWTFSQPELAGGEVWWLWPGHAGLQLSLNEGALFGLGQGGVGWFAFFSVIAAIAIPIWLFAFHGARDLALTVVLGCIMGGVLGNLYDRLGLPGLQWDQFQPNRAGEPVYAVRDFLLLAGRWSDDPRERIVWPNFNVADALLVCGAAFLFFLSVRQTTDASLKRQDAAE